MGKRYILTPIWLATIIGFTPISHLHHIQLSGGENTTKIRNYLQFLDAVYTHITTATSRDTKKSRNKLNELLWIEKPDVRLTHLKLLHTSGHCNDDSLLRLSTMVSMQVVWLEIECNYGFCLWWVTALTPFKPEEQTHDKRVEQQSMENGMKVMTIHEHTTNWYQLYTKHYLHLDKLHRMHYT